MPAAIVDSAFMPVAALVLLRVLMQAGNRRNYFIVPVLFVFGALDAAFHFFTISGRVDLAMRCVYAAAGIVVLLVSVIGGRVIPMFTANAIPGFVARNGGRSNSRSRPSPCSRSSPMPPQSIRASSCVLAAAACATHVARLIGWRSYRVRGPAILAVLHLAYAWIPLGFALLALSAAGHVAHTRDARVHGGRDRRRDHRDDHAHRAWTYGQAARRR